MVDGTRRRWSPKLGGSGSLVSYMHARLGHAVTANGLHYKCQAASKANYRACQSSSCDSSQRALEGLEYIHLADSSNAHWVCRVFPLHVRSRALCLRSNHLSVAALRSVQMIHVPRYRGSPCISLDPFKRARIFFDWMEPVLHLHLIS